MNFENGRPKLTFSIDPDESNECQAPIEEFLYTEEPPASLLLTLSERDLMLHRAVKCIEPSKDSVELLS
jgi:hypothetical protein